MLICFYDTRYLFCFNTLFLKKQKNSENSLPVHTETKSEIFLYNQKTSPPFQDVITIVAPVLSQMDKHITS